MLALLPPAAPGQDAVALERELEALRARVEAVQARLSAKRRQESRAQAALASAEETIARAQRELRAIAGREADERARLAELERERARAQEGLASERERLAEQLRAAWLLSRQSRLKLLLEQDDPGRLGRTLAYFDYFQEARLRAIADLRRKLASLARLRESIDGSLARLRGLEAEARAAQAEARQARAERADALAAVRAELEQEGAALAALESQRNELETLLETLRQALADIPDSLEGKPFDALRGELRWPVAQPFLSPPGTRKGGGLQTQGALLRAAGGTPVHAVAGGRVAYADWLRGFGLLTILDHGDGYLSLYAFKEALYREVGDWVRPGEAIGTAGETGGRTRPALYFELRKDGEPIDPTPWFGGPPEG